MTTVVRMIVGYLVLLLLLRVAGRRTIGEMSPLDFAVLLVISETLQQALVGEDYSMTTAVIAAATLIGLDILVGLVSHRSKRAERWIDGEAMVIVTDGKPNQKRLDKERISEAEILAAARMRGVTRMADIRFAVLESSGKIHVIRHDDPSQPP